MGRGLLYQLVCDVFVEPIFSPLSSRRVVYVVFSQNENIDANVTAVEVEAGLRQGQLSVAPDFAPGTGVKHAVIPSLFGQLWRHVNRPCDLAVPTLHHPFTDINLYDFSAHACERDTVQSWIRHSSLLAPMSPSPGGDGVRVRPKTTPRLSGLTLGSKVRRIACVLSINHRLPEHDLLKIGIHRSDHDGADLPAIFVFRFALGTNLVAERRHTSADFLRISMAGAWTVKDVGERVSFRQIPAANHPAGKPASRLRQA
jgi:hypothetical protein